MKLEGGIPQKSIHYSQIPAPYRKVAEGMEIQFAQQMIQQMKKTIQRTRPESTAENYYQSLLDYERAKMMVKSNEGLGLKEIILRQIYPGLRNARLISKIYQSNTSEEDLYDS